MYSDAISKASYWGEEKDDRDSTCRNCCHVEIRRERIFEGDNIASFTVQNMPFHIIHYDQSIIEHKSEKPGGDIAIFVAE